MEDFSFDLCKFAGSYCSIFNKLSIEKFEVNDGFDKDYLRNIPFQGSRISFI